MRQIVTEGPHPAFEIDFVTCDTKTHDALAPHRDAIRTILENARVSIMGVLTEHPTNPELTNA